jgi:signal transduction histidine kinase/ligand-binding sensor domain-containing protein
MIKNILLILFIVVAFSSCGGNTGINSSSAQNDYLPPTVSPLKFSSIKNIDPKSIKEITVSPVVKKINFKKLPVHSYDTLDTRPIHYEIEETKLIYDKLQVRGFDIDKIPSTPLKFTTSTKLLPPKLIKSGQLHLKDSHLSLFELLETQGVSGTQVLCVFIDKEKFVWIATNQGLYRYDGENLLSYVNAPDSFIVGMIEDTPGQIRIATLNGGMAVLDTKNGAFSETPVIRNSQNNLALILKDKQGRVWETASKPDGVNIIDPKTQSVKKLNGSNSIPNSPVTGLTMDQSGQIWVATLRGIVIINTDKKTIKVLSKINGLKSDTTGALFCDHNGNIWMNNQGINVFNPVSGSFKTITGTEFLKQNNVISFSEDVNGMIWVATQKKGLALIDPLKQTLQNIKMSNGLASNFTLNICTDKKGQAWVPTLNGLNKIGYINNVKERIDNVSVNTLCEDKQGLFWQGSGKGVIIINRKDKTYSRLDITNGLCNDTIEYIGELNNNMFVCSNGGIDIIDSSRSTITHMGVKEGLHDPGILVSMVDDKSNLWLGEATNAVDIFNSANKTIKHIGKAQGLDGQNIADIKQDKRGNIWVSTDNDVYKITPDLHTIERLNVGKGSKVLIIDEHGNLWIGTPHGIFIADDLNKKLYYFSKQQGLIDEHVVSLLKYHSRIYATTLKGVTVIVPPANGLLADTNWACKSFGARYGLTKVNQNFLTDMITNDGLFCWGDNGVSIYDLSKKDTTLSPVYISGINIMDGHQYFTDNKPATKKDKLIWDKVVGPYNLPVNLKLRYNQNYLQFNYSVLNLTPHDSSWYRYRLSGEEKDWNATTSLAVSKSYYNLSAGKYTFEVTSKTDDEKWSPVAQLTFTITPPWWQTWWVYIIYLALFAGSIWSFAHFRSRKLLNDKRLLEDKVNQRTEEVLQQKEEIEAQRDNLEKAFKELKTTQAQLVQSEKMASLGELTAGIAHEIQNPLNFINNFSEVNTELIDEMQQDIDKGNYEDVKAIADDIKQNQQKINQHGKRADFIVKGMLQHSRISKGERDLTNVNVLADEFLKLSYHGLRAKDKSFNAEMTTNFYAGLPRISIVQQDIGRVLLNLFNNAFYAVNQKKKTSDNTYRPLVSVSTSSRDNMVIITVKDNGMGIPAAIREKIMQPFFTTKPTGEGTGLGLSLSYDIIVKAHNGSINVNSTEGEGSEFIIQLPVN